MDTSEIEELIGSLPFFTIIWIKQNDQYHAKFTNQDKYKGKSHDDYLCLHPEFAGLFENIMSGEKEANIEHNNKLVTLHRINDISFYEMHQDNTMVNDELLKMISHKIRGPLNNIIGILTVCDNTKMTEEYKTCISIIKQASYDLIVIANDIVDVVNLINGRFDVKTSLCDLTAIIKSCVDEKKKDAAKKGLQIAYNINSNVPTMIYINEMRMRQAIKNIVKNSIQHTIIGGITIDVQLWTLESHMENKLPFSYVSPNIDEKGVLIKIRDTGVGMNTNKKNILKDVLFPALGSSIQFYKLPGFGMLISTLIVSKMRGRLWFKSEPDMGTVVYLMFQVKISP